MSSRITEGQLAELETQAGLGNISREMLQTFLDCAKWATERQKALTRLLSLARSAAGERGSIELALRSGLVYDFYQAINGRDPVDPRVLRDGVLFWVAKGNFIEARKALGGIEDAGYYAQTAVALACASGETADYVIAREAIGGLYSWRARQSKLDETIVPHLLRLGQVWPECLEEAANRVDRMNRFADEHLRLVVEGFAQGGFFGAARKEAAKIYSSAVRADALFSVWQATRSGADLDGIRAEAAGEEISKNRRAHAYLLAYQGDSSNADLLAARHAAKSGPRSDAAEIWTEIYEATREEGDLEMALGALERMSAGYEQDQARIRLAGAAARAHAYRAAFAHVRLFTDEAERGQALTAIAQALLAEHRLRSAIRTAARITAPFWRCRAMLLLYDDLRGM